MAWWGMTQHSVGRWDRIHMQSLLLLIEGLLLSVRYTLGGLTLVFIKGMRGWYGMGSVS
jgi:hypothetical protein